MPGFALDVFEPRAEGFTCARAWREHRFLTRQRPGRGLVTLYDEDFPDFTSTDLWDDLQAATPEYPRQHARLSALLAAANLEGNTRELAVRATRTHASATVAFEEQDIPWRDVPSRWPLTSEVSRRHDLEDGWRGVVRSELTPTLERWQEALRAHLQPLGADDWQQFWSRLHGVDLETIGTLAQTVLEGTADIYGHGLAVYLGQLDLPIDDVWTSDVDWAFRAPRFDPLFVERNRMPLLIRALRDLEVELPEQTSVQFDYDAEPGVACLPVEIPLDVHIALRLGGGWLDYARSLRGLGMAEHLAHADPTLRVWERWLGDEAPTIGYGFLLEGLMRDRTWLASRLDYVASDDFRVIAHLHWLYRVRKVAALALFDQRLWQAEPGASMAADYEESLSTATRVRHFGDTYLAHLVQSPWSALRAATLLRAEVFAAHLRLYLRREFDEEWWRSGRAARFLKDELWRPGRRYTAEELLGFMGYEGSNPDIAVLAAEFQEVLQPL